MTAGGMEENNIQSRQQISQNIQICGIDLCVRCNYNEFYGIYSEPTFIMLCVLPGSEQTSYVQ